MTQENTGTETALSEEEKEQDPTAEEQLKALQDQIQALTTEKDRFEGGYKGLQKTLSERDRDLKKLGDLDNRIAGIQDTMELLATAITAKGEVENLDAGERQDILTEIKKRRDIQEAKRKQAETETTQREYIQKADALYARAKAVISDDETLERIEDLLISGRLERAEARIVKAEGQKKETPQNKETEEQRIDRLVQERLQKELKDKGLLETFVGSPTGSGGSWSEFEQRYIKGGVSVEDYEKRGRKEGKLR